MPSGEGHTSGAAGAAAAGNGGIVAVNLGVFLVTVTSASLWLLAYTELFPLIGGFLGLGGAFAWIGLASNLMTEERSKQIKAWFDRKVLQRRRTTAAILVLGVIFLATGPLTTAAVRLSNETGAASVKATITTSDERKHRVVVTAASPRTIPIAVGLDGTAEIFLETDALPALRVTVERFRREPVEIPSAFWAQPAVLIRASAGCLGPFNAFHAQLWIEVTTPLNEGTTILSHKEPYAGESVWLGTGKSLPLPPNRVKALQDALVIESVARSASLAVVGQQTVLFAPKPTSSTLAIDHLAYGQTVSAWTCRHKESSCQRPQNLATNATTTLPTGGPFPREIVLDDCEQ